MDFLYLLAFLALAVAFMYVLWTALAYLWLAFWAALGAIWGLFSRHE